MGTRSLIATASPSLMSITMIMDMDMKTEIIPQSKITTTLLKTMMIFIMPNIIS